FQEFQQPGRSLHGQVGRHTVKPFGDRSDGHDRSSLSKMKRPGPAHWSMAPSLNVSILNRSDADDGDFGYIPEARGSWTRSLASGFGLRPGFAAFSGGRRWERRKGWMVTMMGKRLIAGMILTVLMMGVGMGHSCGGERVKRAFEYPQAPRSE